MVNRKTAVSFWSEHSVVKSCCRLSKLQSSVQRLFCCTFLSRMHFISKNSWTQNASRPQMTSTSDSFCSLTIIHTLIMFYFQFQLHTWVIYLYSYAELPRKWSQTARLILAVRDRLKHKIKHVSYHFKVFTFVSWKLINDIVSLTNQKGCFLSALVM